MQYFTFIITIDDLIICIMKISIYLILKVKRYYLQLEKKTYDSKINFLSFGYMNSLIL